jgi:serine/threonine protein kinase
VCYNQLSDYTFLEEIGKGAYAIVKKAFHKPTNSTFAIKVYEKIKLVDPQKRTSVKKEIQILKKLNHKNIVKLIDIIYTTNQVKSR